MSKLANRLRKEMSQPQKIVTQTDEFKLQSPVTEKPKPVDNLINKWFSDPRIDLLEDGHLWLKLFVEADEASPALYQKLYIARVCGARLVPGKNSYVIRPMIDPEGARAWPSEPAYQQFRDKHLRPHLETVKQLLKKVHNWHEEFIPADARGKYYEDIKHLGPEPVRYAPGH